MIVKKINLSLFFLLLFTLGFCENSNSVSDSLIHVWSNSDISDSARFKTIKKYYLKHTFAEPDVVIELTNFHYELAAKNNSTSEMANALNERSFAYYTKGDTKKAKVVLEKAIALFEKVSSRSELASIYANLGNLYGEENNYQEAVNYFSRSLVVFREEKVKTGEARMLNNLGLVYYYIDDYEFAVEYLSNSKTIYEELGLKKRTGSNVLYIGYVYYQQGFYKKAILQGEKALEISKQINNKVSIANCYFLFAKAQKKLGNNELAFLFIEKSLEADKAIKNNKSILERLIFKASLSIDSDLNGTTNKAEEILKSTNFETDPQLKADLYNLLYSCYKKQNKLDLSLAMHEKYVRFSDSVQRQKNNNTIIRNAIQNDFDAKLYENKLENEKQQAQIKLKNLNRTYTLVFISLLILAIIIIYSRSVINSNHKKREKLLEELERLKNIDSALVAESKTFSLDKNKLEQAIFRKLNETDWKVLSILLEDPVIPNKKIAEKAFLSVDGISSSLRRMYEYFEIKESKYKKISLLMEAIKISNS